MPSLVDWSMSSCSVTVVRVPSVWSARLIMSTRVVIAASYRFLEGLLPWLVPCRPGDLGSLILDGPFGGEYEVDFTFGFPPSRV